MTSKTKIFIKHNPIVLNIKAILDKINITIKTNFDVSIELNPFYLKYISFQFFKKNMLAYFYVKISPFEL